MSAMRPLAMQVLSRLSHEHFTSGAALARELGVSRSAISDALKEAMQHHVEIFSLTRRGYRLAIPVEMLDVAEIHDALGDTARHVNVDVLATVDSTNSALLMRAHEGAVRGTCIAAEIQTRGRGRRGRIWRSAFGASLTFSLLWRFEKSASQLGGLSLVVGLALARALRAAGVDNAMLKWPNDVQVDGEKLAGILIETAGDMLGPTAAVIGIGVNTRLSPVTRQAIDQAATDVASHARKPVSRNALLAAILRELVLALSQFQREGFAPFRAAWCAWHALAGAEIDVVQSEGNFIAICRDVADDGSLIVEPLPAYRARLGRSFAVSSADVSIRVAKAMAKQPPPPPQRKSAATLPRGRKA
jgi:BirA family transcriptional regulator, biotin operon repressor / biotin---[acetyl-CoA-carboxylase] ligase